MEDDFGAVQDERTIELSSIAAIFPEIVLDSQSPYQASLEIPIQPVTPLHIRFHHLAGSSAPNPPTPPPSTGPDSDDQNIAGTAKSKQGEGGTEDVYKLVHLPPLSLKIDLPQGYPATKSPVFELSASLDWIPGETLQRLKTEGARLWENLGRDQVVFTYIDHLQQAAEAGFGLGKLPAKEVTLSRDLKIALLDYDLTAKREAFEKETFDCGICLDPKRGAICHRLLSCSHVFCVECLQECYNKCISEGDVDNVKCLDPGCGKDGKGRQLNEANGNNQMVSRRRRHDPTLNPSELLQIPLGEEVVRRYVHLKRKKKLESDKNTIYCPRQWCQGAARSKKHPKPVDPMHDVDEMASDSDTEPLKNPTKASEKEEIPMSERLRICEDCSYAFCFVCEKGWHGETIAYNRCNPRSQKELSEEEKATKEYLENHSTPCPTCTAPCQKTGGCNHMICFKCNTHFCYLCSSYLRESNPYQHFNERHNPCYMRLWELEDGDDEDAEVVVWDIPAIEEDDSDADSENEPDIIWPHMWANAHRDDAAQILDEVEPEQEPLQRVQEDRAVPADIRIEIVNFARGGVANQQFVHAALPPRQVQPLPVRAPPQRGGGARQLPRGRGAGRGRGGQNQNRNHNANPGRGRGGAEARGRGGGGGRAAQPARPRPAAVAAAPQPQPAAPEPRRRVIPVPDNDNDSDSSDTEDEVPLHFRRVAAAPAPGQGNDGQQQPAVLRHMGIDRFLQLAEQDQEDEWDSDELEEGVEDLMEVRRRRELNRRIWG